MILAYAKSDQPTDDEKKAAPANARWRNAQLWRGEVEPGVTELYTHSKEIEDAYKEAGVKKTNLWKKSK